MTIPGYYRIHPTSIEQCMLRNSAINHRAPIQLTRGPLNGEIEHIALPGMWLTRRKLSQMICQFVAIPERQLALGLAEGEQPFLGPDGIAFAEGDLSISYSAQPFLQIIPAHIDYYGLRFTDQFTLPTNHHGLHNNLQKLIKMHAPQQLVSSNLHRFIATRMKSIFNVARSQNDHANANSLQQSILDTLLTNISDKFVVNARTNSRSRIFQRATNFIVDTPIHTITLDRVAAECSTSRRNLEITFAERLGLSPHEFISSVRLNEARRQLIKPKSKQSIASIAEGCGITHLGKFAKNYNDMFGELPSTTLRNHLESQS